MPLVRLLCLRKPEILQANFASKGQVNVKKKDFKKLTLIAYTLALYLWKPNPQVKSWSIKDK